MHVGSGVHGEHTRWALALAVAVLATLSTASPASAQDHRLRWEPEWNRVHPATYTVMGVAAAGALVLDFGVEPGRLEALVRGPEIFDEPVRNALMAPTEEGREAAATLSDILLLSLLVWPYVDAFVVAGIADQNTDVLWQLSSIAAETYAADLLISTVFKLLVARERPHGARCTLEDRLENPRRCGPGGRLRSFYSGHSSAAFNAAGVTCVSHLHLPLYGSRAADTMACGAALLTATIVATLRIIADRHYATDVIIGAVVGLGTGFLLPYLLHFHRWGDAPDPTGGSVAELSSPLSAPMFSFGSAF
jgi:membrane-associated phospholipid phosphatase